MAAMMPRYTISEAPGDEGFAVLDCTQGNAIVACRSGLNEALDFIRGKMAPGTARLYLVHQEMAAQTIDPVPSTRGMAQRLFGSK